MTKAILWLILICGSMYFLLGSVYSIGYNSGVASVQCELHQCMSHVIKYGKCDLNKTSNYPKKANYKGVK